MWDIALRFYFFLFFQWFPIVIVYTTGGCRGWFCPPVLVGTTGQPLHMYAYCAFLAFFFFFFRTWNLQLSNSRYPEPYFGSREMTAWADEIISHLLLADDWSAWLGVSWHMMYVTVLNRPVALINRSAIKFAYIVCGVARYKARDALKVSEFKTAWYFCTRNWVCSM